MNPAAPTLEAPVGPALSAEAPDGRPHRRVGIERLRSRLAAVALVAAALAAVGSSVGALLIGRAATGPSPALVAALGVSVVGGAVLDTAGRVCWALVVNRAEGRLRADLLAAALHQPLAALSEQAVGEILDRVDDDTHELGTLLRRVAWSLVRLSLRLVPMWVVAGMTWWPAAILFPASAAAAVAVARRPSAEVARCKVEEEIAWTDHAAAMEEGVAARDDLRASLGQAFLLRRCAELSAVVLGRVRASSRAGSRLGRRVSLLLHGVLAGVTVVGVALAVDQRLGVAALVTLVLITTQFVGQIDQTARNFPDLQAGFGALTRIRSLMDVTPEPAGGLLVPPGPLGISVRDLEFRYPHGPFALHDIDIEVPAGTTVALVGRTGSGKSTLAGLLTRAVEPPAGSVFLGGVDVTRLDLEELRRAVGVVTQRTELLAGTLAENIALFADIPRAKVEAAVSTLGLDDWVAALPAGLDTLLGPGGTSLSAGEQQLVSFARLLVRDVQVVVLDEATARMDARTEARMARAAERLLTGRTGVVIAHRLSATERAEQVVVLDAGRVVQAGPRATLAARPGPFADLLSAGGGHRGAAIPEGVDPEAIAFYDVAVGGASPIGEGVVGTRRRTVAPPPAEPVGTGPGLARSTAAALLVHPAWGIGGAVLFLAATLLGAYGALTGLAWGHVVAALEAGRRPIVGTVAMVASLVTAPLVMSAATFVYPQWWDAVILRARLAVLRGQTMQHRLAPTPPGEVVSRALDADRFTRYADRWVDFFNGVVVAIVTAAAAGSVLAGCVLAGVMAGSAAASSLGAPRAGRSAAASSRARARFGRSLVSALDAARTVKLAAATDAVHRHLEAADAGRVDAAVREHRVQAALDGVPSVLVQVGVVAAWAVYLAGGWPLATAVLLSTAVSGFEWFGSVAGSVITEAPGVRAWKDATSTLAGGRSLVELPPGVDLVSGRSPVPPLPPRRPLELLDVSDLTVVHPDGTVGVHDASFHVRAGEVVALLGPIGAGKSSLLSALAGLAHHSGTVRWNGIPVEDPQVFLRPGQVAHVGQVPLVLSGTFADNIRLDHQRHLGDAVSDARLERDIDAAGGVDSLVGHRGVRLSGGQVQRVALARTLAAGAELLLADDVSSALDAHTEIELWRALRARGTTVLAATTKRSALERADRVLVLDEGRLVADGPWSELEMRWGALAG